MTYSFLLITAVSYGQEKYDWNGSLMGCDFNISVVAENQSAADEFIQMAIDEIKRIESLISSWNPTSQTSKINQHAGLKPVKVDKELYDLIDRSLKVSKLTQGAFDISYASMDKIWKFDGSMKAMPSDEAIKRSVYKVGYQHIVLNEKETTVYLDQKGMKIGFGAIGKGYAADKAKALLQEKGVTAGILNASGDLNAWGEQPNGENWVVGIKNPLNKDKVFSWLPVENQAVVTSGSYLKYVELNGIRYAHIIDPRTGYPSTGVLSVTVLTKGAELADALATSIFVLGVEVGLDLVNQLKGVECIIIDNENSMHTSTNIELNNFEK